MPELLGQAEVEKVLKRALALSDADETEAVLSMFNESLTRFAYNVVHQNVAEIDASLEVRAAFGRRVGAASTNDLSPLGIERAVRQACDLARHLPERPDWPGLAGPQPPPAVAAYDESVAAMTPDARARAVGDICGEARRNKLLASGALSTTQLEYAVMNSRGLFAYAPGTQADLTFVMEQPQGHGSSYAHATGWRLAQIDFEPAGRMAAGVRRTGHRAGAGRSPPHRGGPHGPFAPCLFLARRRSCGADHLRGRPHS